MINFKVHFELFLDGSHSNVDKHHICWLEEIKTSLAFTKLQTQKNRHSGGFDQSADQTDRMSGHPQFVSATSSKTP
ncbi:hypothetical protein EM89_018165 [Vibrio parahaemolyticus]|nr:hypothetical protein BIW16_16505 [Vibrio sp. OULL4]OOI08991.1 hypothetical protein BIW15_09365 [Vibrio sp. SALL6]OQS66603.1 hypothetical protein EM68_005630 [Vibrio parahaemolyticus]OQT01534.1 hypothetical protein EN04_006515 [Vibrio parahaemolyticus O4:K12 str. K1203]OQS76076.1 hypothetical protein EM54_005355 [Vibrio parahaemolyticus]